MAKFLDRDILQHVADRRIFDVEGLHPVLQRCCQFASSAAECPVPWVLHGTWPIDIDSAPVMRLAIDVARLRTGESTSSLLV
jgi:hypothetical protein